MKTMDLAGMFEDEQILNMMLSAEIERRIKYEGPPEGDTNIITDILGRQYVINQNGKKWDINQPCTNCDDTECMKYLTELSNVKPQIYIYDNIRSICKNPLNNKLLKMLCNWRKHVKDTFIIEKPAGSTKWKRFSICTSELTFLGRKTEMGGIIGIVSLTDKHICSLPSLVSLMEKDEGVHNGVKCLSAGFALLITMYMDWDLYTEENKIIITRLLKKVRKDGKVGLDTYMGTPWHAMFTCVLERRRIHDKLKEFILSRAHLP
jgi:hypothetical protein